MAVCEKTRTHPPNGREGQSWERMKCGPPRTLDHGKLLPRSFWPLRLCPCLTLLPMAHQRARAERIKFLRRTQWLYAARIKTWAGFGIEEDQTPGATRPSEKIDRDSLMIQPLASRTKRKRFPRSKRCFNRQFPPGCCVSSAVVVAQIVRPWSGSLGMSRSPVFRSGPRRAALPA